MSEASPGRSVGVQDRRWHQSPLWRWMGLGGLAGLVWLWAGASSAYILPARYFFREYLKQRAPLVRLKVWQTTTVWKGGSRQTYEEYVFLQVPGKVRVERWVKGKRTQVDIFRGNRHLRWVGGRALPARPRKVQPRYDLFVVERGGSGFGSLTSLLRWMRVEYLGVQKWSRESDYLEQLNVRLGWFGRGPAVIFGVPRSAKGANELWLNKRKFYPVRFLGGATKQGSQVDLRLLEYSFQAGVPLYPGRVQRYQHGKLVMQSLVHRVTRPASFSAKLFTQAN